MGIEVLIPIFGILLVLVPVTGLTMIVTARFALKPFVETLAKALRESGVATGPELQIQIEDLSEQVRLLTRHVRSVEEARSFESELLEGRTETNAGGG